MKTEDKEKSIPFSGDIVNEQTALMDLKEFVDKGYLQEVNRKFFHPLGLALRIEIDDNGQYKLGDILDSRDDAEGFLFNIIERDKEEIVTFMQKAVFVENQKISKYFTRCNLLNEMGYTDNDFIGRNLIYNIEPIPVSISNEEV